MKPRPRIISALCCAISALLLCSGCTANEVEPASKEGLMSSLDSIHSVDTAILLELKCHSGRAGEVGSHTASLTSDISISATLDPIAYHNESFSSITVDGVNTRENKEFYVVPDDDNYYAYAYDEDSDSWTVSTLSDEVVLGLPLRTGFITDWQSLMKNMDDTDKNTNDEGEVISIVYEGEVKADILQNLFGDGIFDSTMYSMEFLLTDEIPCTIVFDAKTGYPTQMELDITGCFIMDDMDVDLGYITVMYSNYNSTDEISVQKRVAISAQDPVQTFYSSCGIWNLFLPYQDASESVSIGNTGQSFESAWNTFQLRLDAGMTALPVKFSDLANIGYELERSDENKTVDANMTLSNVPVVKGNDVMYCTFYNPQTTAQPIALCSVVAIDLRSISCPDNSIKMYLPGEITMGTSREALLSAYGEPDVLEDGFSADTYIWYNTGSDGTPLNQQSFCVEISLLTDSIIRMYLQNIPISANSILPPAA